MKTYSCSIEENLSIRKSIRIILLTLSCLAFYITSLNAYANLCEASVVSQNKYLSHELDHSKHLDITTWSATINYYQERLNQFQRENIWYINKFFKYPGQNLDHNFLLIKKRQPYFEKYGFISNNFLEDRNLFLTDNFEKLIKDSYVETQKLENSNQKYKGNLIYIGFLFINLDGELIPLKYEEDIPKGFRLYDIKYYQGNDNPHIDATTLLKSIAKGILPMPGEFSQHDLSGHLISYLTHPEYAMYYIKFAKEVTKNAKHNNMGLYKYLTRDLSLVHFERFLYFNEHLFLINKVSLIEYLNKIFETLGNYSSFNQSTSNTEDTAKKLKAYIHQNFSKLDAAQKSEALKILRENFYSIMTPLGGELSDFNSKPETNLYQVYFENTLRNKNEFSPLEFLERFLYVLVDLSSITLEDWYFAVKDPYLAKDSNFYQILCEKMYGEHEWFTVIFSTLFDSVCPVE